MKSRAACLLAVGLVASITACGGSDESGNEEYCRLAEEMFSLQEQPSDEQLDALVEAAPDSIREDVELLAEAIRIDDLDGPDAEMLEASRRIATFEDEECDIAPPDE